MTPGLVPPWNSQDMKTTTPTNPSETPVPLHGADEEDIIEVVPEHAAPIDRAHPLAVTCIGAAPLKGYLRSSSASDPAPFEDEMERPSPEVDRCADVSSMERPPLSAYLKPVHTSEPAPFEGIAVGADPGDATFLPNICDYRSAGREQLPAPVASDPRYRKVPSFNHSEAAEDTDFGTALHAMLNLWGIQGGAAERTETRITKMGRNGVTFTYLPSHLEAAKRMSIDEKLAALRFLREKSRKHHEFIMEVGGALADCMQKLGEAYSDRPIEEIACLNGKASNS